MSDTEWQSASEASEVPKEGYTRRRDPRHETWTWVEATVWNERMLAALENGVRGGKWFSLIDKVYRIETLEAAWHRSQGQRRSGRGRWAEREAVWVSGRKSIWQNLSKRLRAERTGQSRYDA